MLTREQAEAASVLATQNALIDLGKHTAKLELEKELRINRLSDLKKYLLKGKDVFPIGVEYTKKDKTSEFYVNLNELNKYVNAVNEFIKLIDDEKVEYLSNIKKLEHYLENIDLDHKTTILENEKLETQIEQKEHYWSNRVTKLREKCMQKNLDYQKLLQEKNQLLKISKILYFMFISLCFSPIIINHVYFQKFIHDTIYFTYNTFYFIHLTFINLYQFLANIYLFLTNIYLFLLNNCMLISSYVIAINYSMFIASLLFVFIVQRHFRIKKNIIFIALILFVNVGNSLYKSIYK